MCVFPHQGLCASRQNLVQVFLLPSDVKGGIQIKVEAKVERRHWPYLFLSPCIWIKMKS
jgi:hypothetical protein